MIRRILVLVLLSIIAIGGSASFRPTRSASTEPCAQDHEAWLTHVLEKMDAIKLGIRRGDLPKVFSRKADYPQDCDAHLSVVTVRIAKLSSSSRPWLGQAATTLGL
jgi:hypothetical protein